MISGTILHYEILEKLGEGGMGEVYKARDTKLDRFVALKFLPANLVATDAEKARFTQEAKAASALNHANICTIFDIQEHEGQLFIVMEYVDGETLRSKKHNFSTKQVVDIGAQAADGLAEAHEKGIVHRDIKPENIMITKNGTVKIMDFGLAKLNTPEEASRLTKAGTTLGTVGYMSPEQVQGQDVDSRSDIFSLGVVLYELLSGESPFKGVHETAIMYEIVNVDPEPVSARKEGIDPELDRILFECLEKDKEERYQSARELSKDLKRFKRDSGKQRISRMSTVHQQFDGSSPSRSGIRTASHSAFENEAPKPEGIRRALHNPRMLWTGIAILFVAVALYLLLPELSGTRDNSPQIMATILPPPAVTYNNQEGSNLAVSPNGKYVAFVGADSMGSVKLWLRPVNSMEAKPLASASISSYPFWSPDSKFIGYFLPGKLMKLSIDGGPPLMICDAQDGRGGTWNKNGTVMFSPDPAGGLYTVSAGGGTPELLVKTDSSRGWQSLRWPYFLPDGDHFLFSVQTSTTGSSPNDGVYVASLKDTKPKLIMMASTNAQYSDGYLFFVRQSILLAQPFDPGNFKLSGESVPLTNNLEYYDVRISGTYSVSGTGLLVYELENKVNEVVDIMNDKAQIVSSLFDRPVWREASFSPDGKMVAFDSYDPAEKNFDVWIYDIARSVTTRLTFNHAADAFPVWSPDGKQVVFSSSRQGDNLNIYEKNADGSGTTRRIFKYDNVVVPTDWSRDGKYILLTAVDYANKNSSNDLVILPTFGDRKPITFLATGFTEIFAKISPDEKWISYMSNESGKFQVYVSPFNGGSKWQVSVNGGGQSWWVDNGKKLYFISPDGKIMGVDVKESGNILTFGRPYTVLDLSKTGFDVSFYDVNQGGTEFLVGVASGKAAPATLTMVSNWRAGLRQDK